MTYAVRSEPWKRDMVCALAVARVAIRKKLHQKRTPIVGVCEWAERNFRIEGTDGTRQLIRLERHQRAILNYVFQLGENAKPRFTTVLWSTPKKSGKTTIAAMVTAYVAETQPHSEIYCLANDEEQAQGRVFAAVRQSIELDSSYSPSLRAVPNRWLVRDKWIRHLLTQSVIKPRPSEYKSEAGANPSLTVWTELWGFIHEKDRRLWAEMTPVPTRPFSMRWVETYAGFEGESDELEKLYKLGLKGRQLTAGELGDLGCFEESPNPDDPVPCWVNEAAGLFMYWDEGLKARRMPWQRGPDGERYYREQAQNLTANQYDRLHLNLWRGSESEFVPMAWWDACKDPMPLAPGERTGLVLGVDAAVSSDCCALVAVSRHPKAREDKTFERHVVERHIRIWTPPPGGVLDYKAEGGLYEEIKYLCQNYRVEQIAYDPYQLHQLMLDVQGEGLAWCREFGQGEERLKGDKCFYDAIRERRYHHLGDEQAREHVKGAAQKSSPNEDTKLRIIKKASDKKIDYTVAAAMATAECLRLLL
ncbi:MAG: terminase TerL endonuclease subunit [Chloroflexota bacterium]